MSLCPAWGCNFHWGPRKESADECAAQVKKFMTALSKISPLFVKWSVEPGGKPRARFSQKELAGLLNGGRMRGELDRRVIPDGGFSFDLYHPKSIVSLHIHVGVYSPWLPNTCGVGILNPKAAGSLLKLPVMKSLCRLIVDHWQPDYGKVSSFDLFKSVEQEMWRIPIGWLTFLGKKYPLPPAVEKHYRVEHIPDRGALVTTCNTRFSSANANHVKSLKRLIDLIEIERWKRPQS